MIEKIVQTILAVVMLVALLASVCIHIAKGNISGVMGYMVCAAFLWLAAKVVQISWKEVCNDKED